MEPLVERLTLTDTRDPSRQLRISFHLSIELPECFVFSIWRDGLCVASARLNRADATAIRAMLGQYV